MKRIIGFIFCLSLMTGTLYAQSSKLIKQLKNKQIELKKQISAKESMLKSTKKDVGSQLKHLATINGQIEERQRYIFSINKDVNTLNGTATTLKSQLAILERDLQNKKRKYASSVQYLYRNRTIQEKLMFIFSARTLAQTYRRLRYMREYATYQRIQGEDIMRRQAQITHKRKEILNVKSAKETMLHARESEKAILVTQQQSKQAVVADLQKKQKSLQGELSKKRREANQLNSRIDKLIAAEIEKARKRAEEEARREAARVAAENRRIAAAEARKKKAAEEEAAKEAAREKNKENATNSKSSHSKKKKDANLADNSSRTVVSTKKSAPRETYSMSSEDRAMANSFAGSRGRLPMPITGSYMVISHYGQYAVEGMKNVKLDNKGIDIQGHPGAQARAVYNGKVVAVFPLNGLFNILIRHGDYISVYCNLSSACVGTGQNVSTRQIIGQVFSDKSDNGRTVLHFQLRREKEKLNPEAWLSR